MDYFKLLVMPFDIPLTFSFKPSYEFGDPVLIQPY